MTTSYIVALVTEREERASGFESEVIRLLTENNRILKEHQAIMGKNKAILTEIDEKLRKVVMNTVS